ncbi:hypothetical protein EDB86DRAFT_2832585 [Lactarius hatsudake]|nr:hypothetical protein EDB86DRAFT_2832585 [Lactarius hatsudake]
MLHLSFTKIAQADARPVFGLKKVARPKGCVRAALPHGHGGRRAHDFRPCCAVAPASASASTSATAPIFAPAQLSGYRDDMNRPMGVSVDALWGFELELISHSPDSAANSTRRQTSEHGQRGFRLPPLASSSRVPSALVLGAMSPAPNVLVPDLHSDSVAQGNSSQDVWEPARRFFELRKIGLEDLDGAGAWHSTIRTLSDAVPPPPSARVGTLLTHAIQACARSLADTHVHAAVEAACFLFQVTADMCFEDQTTPATQGEPNSAPQRPWLDSRTTDTVFLEKPQFYDLIIDSTSYARTERRTTERPGLQLAIREPYARRPTFDHKLHLERRETVDRARPCILQLDADTNGVARASCIGPGLGMDGCVGHVRGRVDRATDGRGPDSWTGSPRVRRRAHGDGIEGRRSSYRPHDYDAGKYDSSDENEDLAMVVRSR